MKNFIVLILISVCNTIYGQIIVEPNSVLFGVKMNDSLTYNYQAYNHLQQPGEPPFYIYLADGWRTDTINGGFHKEIYNNPYINSLEFKKDSYDGHIAFYRYKEGKKYSGKISETLTVSYDDHIVRGVLYGKPYYLSQNIEVIFEANCINGMLQGKGILLVDNNVVAQCFFENGEIVGECLSWDITSKEETRRVYIKGHEEPIKSNLQDVK